MMIKLAEFVMSNSEVSKCPQRPIPEYAFIGRSNVGKSSLINMLTGRKSLAKTSGTPGKTQLINHFIINNNWYLVDLPGYGYAKVSRTLKKNFQKFITNYFEQRQQLAMAFVLVDIRHSAQSIDLDFMSYLGENGIPFSIIFTKADKLKPRETEDQIALYKTELLKTWESLPPIFITSAVKNIGQEDLLNFIAQTNETINQLKQSQ